MKITHINYSIFKKRRAIMEFLSREQIINDLQQPFETYIEKFDIDDIGIFEEQGQDEIYHMGYTVKKDGKTYHIHTPFRKQENGFTPINNRWTMETDEPDGHDMSFLDVESIFREI